MNDIPFSWDKLMRDMARGLLGVKGHDMGIGEPERVRSKLRHHEGAFGRDRKIGRRGLPGSKHLHYAGRNVNARGY